MKAVFFGKSIRVVSDDLVPETADAVDRILHSIEGDTAIESVEAVHEIEVGHRIQGRTATKDSVTHKRAVAVNGGTLRGTLDANGGTERVGGRVVEEHAAAFEKIEELSIGTAMDRLEIEARAGRISALSNRIRYRVDLVDRSRSS